MQFARDLMTGSNWSLLTNHTANTGGQWVKHTATSSSNGRFYLYGGRVHNGSSAAGGSSYYSLAYLPVVPASADYAVECDLVLLASSASLNIGPCVRVSTTDDTYYAAFYQDGQVTLIKRIAGVNTTIGTWVSALSYGATYRMRLEAVGDQITVDIDDVERISVTDTSITATGRVGLRAGSVSNQNDGIHIDNLIAEDATAPAVARTRVIGIIGL